MTDESLDNKQPPKTPDEVKFVRAKIKDYDNVLIFDGYIRFSDEYTIEVQLPDYPEAFHALLLNTKVKVCVHSPLSAEICYFALVTALSDHQAQLKVLHNMQPENKRQYYRVPTNITAALEYQLIKDESLRLPRPIQITIKNISCGGMMFVASQDLHEGEQFQTTFILGRAPITIRFRVLRKTVANNQVYFFGAFFMDNTQSKQDMICSYVNRKQLEEQYKGE